MTKRRLNELKAEALQKIEIAMERIAHPETCADIAYYLLCKRLEIAQNQNLIAWVDEQIAKKVWRKA